MMDEAGLGHSGTPDGRCSSSSALGYKPPITPKVLNGCALAENIDMVQVVRLN